MIGIEPGTGANHENLDLYDPRVTGAGAGRDRILGERRQADPPRLSCAESY
jgi:hypothetical protein